MLAMLALKQEINPSLVESPAFKGVSDEKGRDEGILNRIINVIIVNKNLTDIWLFQIFCLSLQRKNV
jgi:hypothetical protein